MRPLAGKMDHSIPGDTSYLPSALPQPQPGPVPLLTPPLLTPWLTHVLQRAPHPRGMPACLARYPWLRQWSSFKAAFSGNVASSFQQVVGTESHKGVPFASSFIRHRYVQRATEVQALGGQDAGPGLSWQKERKPACGKGRA